MIVLDGYFYVFVVIGVNFCMVRMSSRFVIMLLYLAYIVISLHKHVNLNVTQKK